MIFLLTLLGSVLLTIALIPMFSVAAVRFNAVDFPNERKVHTRPIPRIGGVAMALGTFVPLLYAFRENDFLVAYLTGSSILVLFGIVDDFRELSPKVKFTGQIVAALIAVFYGGVVIRSLGTLLSEGWALPSWSAVPLTIFVIVGVTNAINLADGLDGLAGGICLLIFAGIGYLAYLAGNTTIGLISLALGGALFGFLRFNTHPATIFMGDAGSQFLGFSVVILAIALTQGSKVYSPILPLILVGFPVLDTLTVMILRITRGRSPFSADKNHFHHHLMKLGFLHPQSVLIIYVLQTTLVIAAIMFRYYSDWLLFTGYLSFCFAVLAVFSLAERNGWRSQEFERFNQRLKNWFGKLKREGRVIKTTFPLFEYGIPFLLIITCLLTTDVPPFVSIAAVFCGGSLLIAVFLRNRLAPVILRFALYMLIPCAVYFSDLQSQKCLHGTALSVYNGAFGIFALLMIFVSKFSRRNEGFKSTPLDFLIIILAVVVPNLPDQRIQEYRIGLSAAKIIMLYFSFEVLLAELRGRSGRLCLGVIASLTLLALH